MAIDVNKRVLEITVDGIKMLVGENDFVETQIQLPEEMFESKYIYSFKVNENTVLLSSRNNGAKLYRYNIREKTLKVIYDVKGTYSSYQIIGDYCLIGGMNSKLLSYNIQTDELSVITEKTIYTPNFSPLGEDFIIHSYNDSSIFIYNSLTNSAKFIGSVSGIYFCIPVNNDMCILSSNSSSTKGCWFYNKNEDSVIKISDEGYQWKSVIYVPNKILISCNNNTYGLYEYDLINKTFLKIYDLGRDWSVCVNIKNKYLISTSYTSGSYGILVYDSDLKTLELLFDSGGNWGGLLILNNIYYIYNTYGYGQSGQKYGIYEYSPETNIFHQVYDNGSHWHSIAKIGNDYLIGSKQTTYLYGLLLYEASTKTFTRIYDGYNHTLLFITNDKVILGMGAGTRNTANGSKTEGVLSYDILTKKITQIFNSGDFLDASIQNNIYYIYNNKSESNINSTNYGKLYNGKVLQYLPESNTVKLIGYRIGRL